MQQHVMTSAPGYSVIMFVWYDHFSLKALRAAAVIYKDRRSFCYLPHLRYILAQKNLQSAVSSHYGKFSEVFSK